jgi:predicted RNase H-like HicB family nuclease
MKICYTCNTYGKSRKDKGRRMKIKVVVHEAEEGGFWAEVPAIPGCATQGETFEELLANLYEAVEGCLSVDVDVEKTKGDGKQRVVEIAI